MSKHFLAPYAQAVLGNFLVFAKILPVGTCMDEISISDVNSHKTSLVITCDYLYVPKNVLL